MMSYKPLLQKSDQNLEETFLLHCVCPRLYKPIRDRMIQNNPKGDPLMAQTLCTLVLMPFLMIGCGRNGKKEQPGDTPPPKEQTIPMEDFLKDRLETQRVCYKAYDQGIDEYGYEKDHLPFMKGLVVITKDHGLILKFASEEAPKCTLDVYTTLGCDYIKSEGVCEAG